MQKYNAGALVVYHGKSAQVSAVSADKIEIRIEGGASKSVRAKDIEFLHPGPASARTAGTGLLRDHGADGGGDVSLFRVCGASLFRKYSRLFLGGVSASFTGNLFYGFSGGWRKGASEGGDRSRTCGDSRKNSGKGAEGGSA